MKQDYAAEIRGFEQNMIAEEKSAATIDKYLRDVHGFCSHLSGRRISKEETVAYKEDLTSRYAPASVNSMLIGDKPLPAVYRIAGLLCPSPENPAADFLQRGQGADQARAAPTGGCSGEQPAVTGHSNHLWYRDPGVRAAVYHSRSGARGPGGGELQK